MFIIYVALSCPNLCSYHNLILQDTAKTTLQEQNGADRPNQFTAKPSDTYSQIANDSDPMEMFEGVANNWAALAFSDK